MSKWLWHPDREKETDRLALLLEKDLFLDQEAWTKAEAVRRSDEAEDSAAWQAESLRKTNLVRRENRILLSKETAELQAAADFGGLPEQEKLHRALSYMGATEAQVRELMPVFNDPRRAIAAEPLVWQAAVFSHLIHGALEMGALELTAEQVRAWIRKRFEVPGDEESFRVSVWGFLSGLEKQRVLHHIERQRFLIAVPSFASALALAADFRTGGVYPLTWQKDWPSKEVAARLGQVFGRIQGKPERWATVSGLLPEVRTQDTPEGTFKHYQMPGLEAAALRRLFLAAGFVRLASPGRRVSQVM